MSGTTQQVTEHPLRCMMKAAREGNKRFIDLGGNAHMTMFEAVRASFEQRDGGSFYRYCLKLESLCPVTCSRTAPQAAKCFNLCMRALQQYDPARSADPWTLTEKILREDRG